MQAVCQFIIFSFEPMVIWYLRNDLVERGGERRSDMHDMVTDLSQKGRWAGGSRGHLVFGEAESMVGLFVGRTAAAATIVKDNGSFPTLLTSHNRHRSLFPPQIPLRNSLRSGDSTPAPTLPATHARPGVD